MPCLAILFEASPHIWWPSNTTEPLARPSMPMIARSVVVLPAPFRPSKVTTSPWRISKFMPCRMCDSPYQPWRSATASRLVVAADASGMPRPHIGFDHGGIRRYFGIDAFGQDLAPCQHGDAIRQIGHDGEVMFDHQHGAVARHVSDQGGNTADILGSEAGHRFVEQQHLGI